MNSYCKNKKISFYDFIELDLKKSIFHHKLATHLFKYKNVHNFLKKREGSWGPSSKCNLQRYQPNESYSIEHCEHEASSPLRILGWMFYLNTIDKGGETCFPQQNIKISPKKGDLIIWPAGWTHSHFGMSAKDQVKYIITGWCEYKTKNYAEN